MNQKHRNPYERAVLALAGATLALLCTGTAWADSGGVQEMTLQYTGTLIDAHVTVDQTTQGKVAKTQTRVFDGVVQPGESFTIVGADRNGTLGPVIRIRVNGKMNATFVVNCAQPVGPGVSSGNFMITDVVSDCEDDGEDPGDDPDDPGDDPDDPGDDPDDPADDPDCAECDGQVTELTLIYQGDEPVEVRVEQKIRNSNQVIFEEMVEPGHPFTVVGGSRHGTMGSKILFYTDDHFRGSLHTSCSEPIGPGLVFRDFEIVEGESRNGGRLCPLEDGEGDGNDETGCDECDGQVIELTLRYNGEEMARVEATQKLRGHDFTIFSDLLEPGDPFTVYGQWPGGRLGSMIKIYVDGEFNARIHTSCSEPIGPGLVVGDFEVLDGASRNGGRLCALPADEP